MEAYFGKTRHQTANFRYRPGSIQSTWHPQYFNQPHCSGTGHQPRQPLLPLPQQRAINRTATEPLSIEDIWFFLHLNFELALEYRFIYQDSDYITLKCPSLTAKFQQLLTALYRTLVRLLTALSTSGTLLVTSNNVIEDISLNMLLICTQWIHFKKHLAGISEANIAGDHFNQGIYQVLSLLLPYLDQAHREHLQKLREAYQ